MQIKGFGMNHIEIFRMVNNKYDDLVESENGEVTNLDVIKITAPKKMIHDFYYMSIHSCGLNAVDLISKFFPNSKLIFEDVDDISITYNLVKTF
ncbi:hypothetical protein BphiR1888_00003 [Acinetobacter phage Bphi-R1888]|nr:hypothetical protein BphiR1888_00003 [Acinetobacter phage Bphi-R1888]